MSEEGQYLIFLTEQYAARKNMTGGEAFALFEKKGILPMILGQYYTYHTERVENAVDDIDRMLAAKPLD